MSHTVPLEFDPYQSERAGKMMDNRKLNGSTTFINFMLSLIVILLSCAISGQVWFNNAISERVTKVETTLILLLDGRIKP